MLNFKVLLMGTFEWLPGVSLKGMIVCTGPNEWDGVNKVELVSIRGSLKNMPQVSLVISMTGVRQTHQAPNFNCII